MSDFYFAVYHWDKVYNKHVLIKICQNYAEAEDYVTENYQHRRRSGRDKVIIRDQANKDWLTWEVDYMPQFEPLKTWKFPSSSSGATYETRLTKTGILSCNCRGWTYKKPGKARFCKHTTQIIHDEKLDVVEQGQYLILNDKKIAAAKKKYAGALVGTPQQKLMLLVADYEALVARMTQLEPAQMWDMLEEVEVAKFKVEAFLDALEGQEGSAAAQFHAAQAKLGALLQ